YDRGEAFGTDTWADYATNPESDRFLEFWNLVFPGYNRTEAPDGTGLLEDLGRKNIDTGLGMIRAAFINQGVSDLFDTDDFKPLIAKVVELSGKPYEGMKSLSHRVIAEHIRMVSMTLADGVSFGTSEREYVVRKVMRRASRHAYLLGLKEPTLYKLVPLVVETLGGAYPEIVAAQDSVMKSIEQEEKRFLTTLENGIERLNSAFVLEGLRQNVQLIDDEPQTRLDISSEKAGHWELWAYSVFQDKYKVFKIITDLAKEMSEVYKKPVSISSFKISSLVAPYSKTYDTYGSLPPTEPIDLPKRETIKPPSDFRLSGQAAF
ncbi:MAG: alanine--tRNA ligase, partial [Pleurocapsa sp. SU_196_0]|nr:alanine--tRNA ligase [Pleurocapsa sp. SU_196_0]